MFSIGDFARHGRVSVRMLRHYDAIGLLRPARVDPATGYRSYQADQLARLNRIVALKDLGFTLEQVGSMLDKQVTGRELRGMLRLRHAELAAQIEADTARLRRVEAATVVHRGPMDNVLGTYDALAHWIEANGYSSAGPAREFYLATPDGDPDAWVTELQEPIARA